MIRKPINLDELRQFIIDNPGTDLAAIRARFDAKKTKVDRGMRPLKKEGFTFRQSDQGHIRFYESGYAKENNIQAVILSEKTSSWYRNRKKAREKAKAKVKMSNYDLSLWLNELWPAPVSR